MSQDTEKKLKIDREPCGMMKLDKYLLKLSRDSFQLKRMPNYRFEYVLSPMS